MAFEHYFPGKTCIDDIDNLEAIVRQAAPSLLGLDGPMSAGKTPLGRELSRRLTIPVIDLDDFLVGDGRPYLQQMRQSELREAVARRPLIVSGVHLVEVLHAVGAVPELLVYVVHWYKTGHPADADVMSPEIDPERPWDNLGRVDTGIRIYHRDWRPIAAANVVFLNCERDREGAPQLTASQD